MSSAETLQDGTGSTPNFLVGRLIDKERATPARPGTLERLGGAGNFDDAMPDQAPGAILHVSPAKSIQTCILNSRSLAYITSVNTQGPGSDCALLMATPCGMLMPIHFHVDGP